MVTVISFCKGKTSVSFNLILFKESITKNLGILIFHDTDHILSCERMYYFVDRITNVMYRNTITIESNNSLMCRVFLLHLKAVQSAMRYSERFLFRVLTPVKALLRNKMKAKHREALRRWNAQQKACNAIYFSVCHCVKTVSRPLVLRPFCS